jgi:hypothetical protein
MGKLRVYFDSSDFDKRFIEESGSDEVEILCFNARAIALSSIYFKEIISALNRKLCEKVISRENYSVIENKMIEEFENVEIFNLIPEVISRSIFLLEKNILRYLMFCTLLRLFVGVQIYLFQQVKER